jgi:hypothetical protein
MARAQAGGTIGKNGERYEGGQFLPSSAETIKGQVKKTARKGGPRKVEIAPYIWAESREGFRPIYAYLAGVQLYDRKTDQFAYNESFRGWGGGLPEGFRERTEALIAAYNSGERWIEVSA